jgi:hypothetical protein
VMYVSADVTGEKGRLIEPPRFTFNYPTLR